MLEFGLTTKNLTKNPMQGNISTMTSMRPAIKRLLKDKNIIHFLLTRLPPSHVSTQADNTILQSHRDFVTIY